ncbi:hypothetical protein PIB30_080744 [Stylosanthes scabra]|uniref:Uncharacterized protein n=1 Tax=Stylosanthes scabra TaxID=79078 RepID=A0ABU6RRV8_9FABA|nr:hypothetical protein [Stylosanthes scabra]
MGSTTPSLKSETSQGHSLLPCRRLAGTEKRTTLFGRFRGGKVTDRGGRGGGRGSKNKSAGKLLDLEHGKEIPPVLMNDIHCEVDNNHQRFEDSLESKQQQRRENEVRKIEDLLESRS